MYRSFSLKEFHNCTRRFHLKTLCSFCSLLLAMLTPLIASGVLPPNVSASTAPSLAEKAMIGENLPNIILIVADSVLTPFAPPAKSEAKDIYLPREVIIDKIRGGLLGQILGNLNGLPHEMKYIDEPGNVKNYVPSLPDGAWSDDDTDFEWVYVVEMQRNRTACLPHDQIFDLWKERINNRIWCSNLYARCLMDIGIKPPYTGNGTLNPWANFNISGQFLCETFGLMAPAMPRTAARIGLNYTTVAIDNEPAQATQLFTAMIATAFIESDVGKILDAGMNALDEKSILMEIINDIKKWH